MRAQHIRLAAAFAAAIAVVGVPLTVAHSARADVVAYLVNVTVRPGYGFANADDAIRYGRGICEKLAQGRTYGALITDLRADFNTSDDYQAAYLISQAVNELCPALIWQLRTSATHYRPAGEP